MSQRQPPASALFGAVAASYARQRPTDPTAFFEAFVQRLPVRPSACPVVWDCGCGSGQASVALADRGVLAAHWPGSGSIGVGEQWRFMGRWGQLQPRPQ